MLSTGVPSLASTYNLSYDELGRLVGVVDDGGNTATYNYDALGNIVSIGRGNSAVSIVSFSPGSGPVGANVTISGAGFSATAGQNTVAFNGTSATIVSATTNQLVASVPAGATTGPITVTSPAGSATSTNSFSVIPVQAPTITGISPTIGVVGTTVSINGTNFQTSPIDNSLVLNARAVRVSTATPTAIGMVVPPSSSSGRFVVSTPYGRATSSQDFFVPPGSHTVADVGVTGRMTVGNSQTVTFATANQIGLILFDESTGHRVSLQVTNSSFGNCYGGSIQILNTDGSVAGNINLCAGSFLDTITLSASASYTVVINPPTNTTGSVTFMVYDVPPDAASTITAGGPPVTLAITAPGQDGILTFSGTASQRISLNMTQNTGFAPCGNLKIVNPDGTYLLNTGYCYGYFADAPTLPATGTYTIKFDPDPTRTGTATFTLYDVPPDAASTITAGGPPVTLAITAPGQDGILTFSGTASQRISLNMTQNTGFAPCGNLKIVNPDGTYLLNTGYCYGYFADALTLPATGTYTIKFDPDPTRTGTATFTLYDVPPDAASTITAGGPPVTLAITAPGQDGILTFSGTASQRISLNMTQNTGFAPCGNLKIVNPDGTYLLNTGYCYGYFADALTLPATGTYTIKFDPDPTRTGTATFTLYDVPPDAASTITAGGPPVTLAITTPGQDGVLTFTGAASQVVSLGMTQDSSFQPCGNVRITNPDGTTLVNSNYCYSYSSGALTLSVAGTYTIKFDPDPTKTGTATFTLSNQ
ncbi:IPT/TIG domain-containing protein [Burkholderia pseudomallei]|uniref:IPT/TIG domain-containing protein n=1 Tax=Burkholderia pseudomallei TaxID=28450 RepID=UPI0018A2399B|nr:IPT/TIG domain-containing protein [Burkholderia pseudomallei]